MAENVGGIRRIGEVVEMYVGGRKEERKDFDYVKRK